MYKSLRPLLFRLEPETAHHLTLQALRFAGAFPPFYALLQSLYRAPDRPVQAFGLTFKNPVGLAAGYDKDAVAIRGISTLGFGHVEVGTVTPRPQPGNPRPRVFRLIEEEAVINRMGFPGRGEAAVATSIRGRQGGQAGLIRFLQKGRIAPAKRAIPNRMILGINIGKNKETPNEEAVLDYLELLQCFAPYADYLVDASGK